MYVCGWVGVLFKHISLWFHGEWCKLAATALITEVCVAHPDPLLTLIPQSPTTTTTTTTTPNTQTHARAVNTHVANTHANTQSHYWMPGIFFSLFVCVCLVMSSCPWQPLCEKDSHSYTKIDVDIRDVPEYEHIIQEGTDNVLETNICSTRRTKSAPWLTRLYVSHYVSSYRFLTSSYSPLSLQNRTLILQTSCFIYCALLKRDRYVL